MALPTFNVLSICTGIGGIELGLELAGRELGLQFRTVCMVEREVYAAALLAQQMEQGRLDPCPIWTDIKTFPEVAHLFRGKVDLIHAGLPCQPYSVAGKRKGDKDERYIWDDFFRIVREVQPALVFLENVSGLLAWFQPIGQELSAMGFQFEAGLFTAAETGAPHKRQRFFCLAYDQYRGFRFRADEAEPKPMRRSDARISEGSISELVNSDLTGPQGRNSDWRSKGGKKSYELPAWPPGPTDARWAEIIRERPDLAPAVAHTPGKRLKQHSERDSEPQQSRERTSCGNNSGGRCEGEGQAPESEICGVAPGLPHWMDRVNTNRVDRLRALGNAVVPQCAARAFIELWRKMR